jgi:hypothetical protein
LPAARGRSLAVSPNAQVRARPFSAGSPRTEFSEEETPGLVIAHAAKIEPPRFIDALRENRG